MQVIFQLTDKQLPEAMRQVMNPPVREGTSITSETLADLDLDNVNLIKEIDANMSFNEANNIVFHKFLMLFQNYTGNSILGYVDEVSKRLIWSGSQHHFYLLGMNKVVLRLFGTIAKAKEAVVMFQEEIKDLSWEHDPKTYFTKSEQLVPLANSWYLAIEPYISGFNWNTLQLKPGSTLGIENMSGGAFQTSYDNEPVYDTSEYCYLSSFLKILAKEGQIDDDFKEALDLAIGANAVARKAYRRVIAMSYTRTINPVLPDVQHETIQ